MSNKEAVALADAPETAVQSMLALVRDHLQLDVAFVSQVADGERVFRFVSADGEDCPVQVGGSDPTEESYCAYVLSGDVPEFLPDPSQHPVTARLPATHELPVGTHLSVPLVFSDGNPYGTFCAFGHSVRDDLDERDLQMLKVLAGIVVDHVEHADAARRERECQAEEFLSLDFGDDVEIVLQPMFDLTDGQVAGVEALARFSSLGVGPAEVFAGAWDVGVGVELEVRALDAAFRLISAVPDAAYLSVNASPETMASDEFAAALDALDVSRLVVEVTEHAASEDYVQLRRIADDLRQRGARLAIDDVGAGFAGLSQILALRPDILKLDGALVSDLDTEPDKRAMISAIVSYTGYLGATLVAERIETCAESVALRDLGVRVGQGYYLCRPQAADNLRHHLSAG